MARAMKDSGIEWIGEIPEEWEICQYKNVIELVIDNRGKTPPIDDMGIPLLEIDGLSSKYADVSNVTKFVSIEIFNNFFRKYLKSDDILFATVGSIGKIALVSKDFNYCIAQNIVGIRINVNNDNLFWFYYMQSESFKMTYMQYNKGNIQESIKISNLMQGKVPSPPLPEQQTIANFLDSKCILIDSIIEKQKAVIEKLKLYKQSVITEAVTKGLNSTVKMKDSGIAWIGDIPEVWKIRKLKYLGYLSANGVDKKIQDGEKLYKSVHYMNVYNSSLSEIKNSEDYLIISANDAKAKSCTLEKGDVLFTNSSETPDDMGHSTVVCENIDNTLFGYHLMRFRPNIEIYLQFEKYLFGSYYMRKWFEYRSIGMTRYGVSYSDFAEVLIILPPLPEQQAIADYLDTKCEGIDNVITNKQKLIDKLTDYKKSLIYECVTGKKEVV